MALFEYLSKLDSWDFFQRDVWLFCIDVNSGYEAVTGLDHDYVIKRVLFYI